jgi:hypothetical protein
MESSYAALYRALGKPLVEHYDMCYRRIRWTCGCTATGLSAQKMTVKTCIRHRLVPMHESIWLRR